jgi:hypothetical protein
MPHTSRTTRLAGALGAGAVVALGTAVPAAAYVDPAQPTVDVGRALRQIDQPRGTRHEPLLLRRPHITTHVVEIDDGSVELLQIGLGALGGAALVAGAVAAVGIHHRHHHAARPA